MPSTPATADSSRAGAAPPVLEIEDLSVRFATPDGEIPAVNAFSLALRPGECVGVVTADRHRLLALHQRLTEALKVGAPAFPASVTGL